MQADSKICTKCELTLKWDDFHSRPNGVLHSWCKKCKYRYEKQKRLTNSAFAEEKKQKDRASRKKNWANNSELREKQRIKQLMLNYGLTIEQYEEMFKKQNGVCYICSNKETGHKKQKYLNVDHDHKTGKVRGLLCSPCNQGLGLFKHSVDFLQKAKDYIIAFS